MLITMQNFILIGSGIFSTHERRNCLKTTKRVELVFDKEAIFSSSYTVVSGNSGVTRNKVHFHLEVESCPNSQPL